MGIAAPTAASASDTNRGSPFCGKVYEPLGLARRAGTHVALNRGAHFRAEPPKMIVHQVLAHCLMAQLGFRSSLGPSRHVMPLRARSRLILAGRCDVCCQRNSTEHTCQAAALMVTGWWLAHGDGWRPWRALRRRSQSQQAMPALAPRAERGGNRCVAAVRTL